MQNTLLNQEYFEDCATKIAPKLLGKIIEFNGCKGIIVETECYLDDEASHARKRTPRSELMYSTHGQIYVYLIYGMYPCLNVTTNKGSPGAVLIRAIEPLEGIETMQERRTKGKKCKSMRITNLCSGPGKLCNAFNITKEQNNKPINQEIEIYDQLKKTNNNAPKITEADIISTTRIGITKDTHLKWRFYLKDNNHISQK